MPLVTASRISMHYGGPLLLADVSLKVEPGDRIGLIGRNGSGKTTLLKLLGGRLDPTDGAVVQARSMRTAYQAQELEFRPGTTVIDEMRSVFRSEAANEAELRSLEVRLAEATDPEVRARLLREYERRQHEQEASGVYDIDRRIVSVLSSLGLPEAAWEKPIDGFSGGERNVIGLARVLLSSPDLMLLDEPSNHLDMEGVEWFIDFLRRSKAAFLMVSHNRHLLDATVRTVWWNAPEAHGPATTRGDWSHPMPAPSITRQRTSSGAYFTSRRSSGSSSAPPPRTSVASVSGSSVKGPECVFCPRMNRLAASPSHVTPTCVHSSKRRTAWLSRNSLPCRAKPMAPVFWFNSICHIF